MSYNAPLSDMKFLLKDVFHADTFWPYFPYINENLDLDTAFAILDESAKFSSDVVQPLNRNSDEQGVTFSSGEVKTPDGFVECYKSFSESGWGGLCGNPEYEGTGMPKMLGVLVDEMNYSASNAFTLYSSLTAGAALCIDSHASEQLKQTYLPKLYSGEWSAAMAMTESDAGSDLKNIKSKAILISDDQYKISGTKIFITAGEHDLTSNIIHLVLAKVQNDERISLFLVPKFLNDSSFNHVIASSIEHKMGLNGSATCVMNYDGSLGYLIGEQGKGLSCMFTMMNYERLAIGIQGLANSETAYQLAVNYAKDRQQGTNPVSKQPCSIVEHGDVRRMLLTIRALTEAGRALSVYTGLQLDLSKYGDKVQQPIASKFSQLLTPVTKSFFTDRGLECTILAQQVFGGHGYIRESGIEQIVRDTRIAQIYEGTNGIQAIDFLARKIVHDKQIVLCQFVEQINSNMAEFEFVDQKLCSLVMKNFKTLIDLASVISKKSSSTLSNSCAVNFLDAFGYNIYGYFWLLMLEKAYSSNQHSCENKQYLCNFYFDQLMPNVDLHLKRLQSFDNSIMAMPIENF